MEERRLEASRLIDQIRVDGGGLTPEDTQFLQEHRPSLLQSVLKGREREAKSAKLYCDLEA